MNVTLTSIVLFDYANRNYNIVLNLSTGPLTLWHTPRKEQHARAFLIRMLAREDVPVLCRDFATDRTKPLPDFVQAIFRLSEQPMVMATLSYD